MGREQTLLDRLAALADENRGGLEPSATEDLEALMNSVRRQLLRLLNARHGACEAQPDYGLPALADLTIGTGDHVHTVQKAIQTTIEKYEPRLRRVRVSPVVDEEVPESRRPLRFRIDAVLMGRTQQHRVYYETSIAGAGTFDISD